MIDRTVSPSLSKLVKPTLLQPQKLIALDDIKLFCFNSPGSKVMHLEMVFSGGQLLQNKPLQAGVCGQLMQEGTKSYISKEIAEIFDFYGASLQIETDINYQTISVSCTSENFNKIAPILKEIINEPIFPENEFNLHLNTSLERFKVNKQKVDFVSRQHFGANLYGKNHTLGKITNVKDYENLNLEDIQQFYKTKVSGRIEHVIASGDIDETITKLIVSLVESINKKSPQQKEKINLQVVSTIEEKIQVENAVQSSIRIGFRAVPRNHADFPALQVVNMILGGYFGSRLMSNIREDKGYTYGIGSSLIPLRDDGYLAIATEVGSKVTNEALHEIHKEIKLICTEKIERNELELARNYLIGSFIRNSDGIFAMADRFKAIYYSGLDYSYYDNYFRVIENISSGELQVIAKKYLDKPFIQVVAGG